MTGLLTDLSDALARTVAESAPSVVRVEGRRRMPASGIAWQADVIVTAHHVLESDEELKVGLADGSPLTATLVGRDSSTDLAALRLSKPALTPARWSGLEQLKVGHIVLALGRPGATVRATMGIVSAFGEGWRTPLGGKVDHYLQTDLAMYPGFSGGPLVDSSGRVIGLNTSALLRGTGVTVPTPTIRRVVEVLLAHGSVPRGYLGVSVNPVRLNEPLAAQLGQATGLLVNAVEPSSPAEQGGLLLGDVILKIDDTATLLPDDLLGYLAAHSSGAATVHVLRGGEPKSLAVKLSQRS